MKEALFYELIDKDRGIIKCLLCPKECLIKKDQVGFCRVRKNIDKQLYSLIYSKVSSYGMDPIEKKKTALSFLSRNNGFITGHNGL